MKNVFLGSLLATLPWLCAAQQVMLPELYRVHGLSSGEALNVRAEPNARSEVLTSLPHDRQGVEVVAIDGNWAQINVGEGHGWVALRFLDQQPGVWQAGQLPKTLNCFGTEPFWEATFDANEVRLATPGNATEQRFSAESVADRGFPEDRLRAIQAGDLTAVVVPKACSDGMSDRRYALEAVVLLRNHNRPLFSGCCSIAPDR